MQQLIKGIEEISACCSTGVWEYNATGLPKGTSPFSRCNNCGEMSEVIFLSPMGKELKHHDAYEEISRDRNR
jgi:hypothetical protein